MTPPRCVDEESKTMLPNGSQTLQTNVKEECKGCYKGHVFILHWQTFTKIVFVLWCMVFGFKVMWMFLLQRLDFGGMGRFVSISTWTSIPMGLLVVIPHYLSVFLWSCHEDYMLILCSRGETYAKPNWVARALSHPNFVTSGPKFWQI